MPFDINVAFNVETKELVNARNALQSLVQVSKDINSSQDKAAKSAEALVKANDKVAESAKSASKALEDSAKSAEKTEKSTKSLAGEGDAAASKLAKLKDQLSFLRDDLNLSEVGFTKSQAGVLAWAKSVNASSSTIKEFASTFDKLNKVAGLNPFDQSAKGLSALNSELRELKQVQTLAAESVGLTSKQVQMLSRDLEGVRQQNEAFGRSADEGVQKHRAAFIEAANAVNAYKDQVKIAQRESENLFKAEQELARNRKLVNDELARSWGSSVGKKSQALSDLADQYAEEERMAAAHQAKLQKINYTAGNDAAAEYYRRQAAASKIASDAIEELERDTRKLIITNELLDRGFTSSSANALFRYRESLERTGVSAMELKQKLYLLEQDLMKRQNTSPFAKMREDIKQVTQQTNHLARAISVQLGDVAISLAGGQNPFVVLMQQGDQIRGAVQQAVDAGQKIDQAMKGAFISMAQSAKLVGVVIKEFAMDGLRSASNALQVVSKHTAEVEAINKRYENGSISLTRSKRLLTAQSLQLDKAMGTLRITALGVAGVFAGVLLKAFYDLSKEQDNMAKANVQFGASFGASTSEAIAMSKSLMDVGVSSKNATVAIEAMMKTGTLGKESFETIAKAASDAQKYIGISIEDTVKKFGDLAKDPIKVLSEFTQQTGYLSQAQLQLVRDLVEAGEGAEAQRVAIKLLEDGYKSMTSQAQEDMSALGRATLTLKDSTSTLWDEFKNSSAVETALNSVKVVIGVLNGAVQVAVISAKTLWATLVSAGKGLKALYENALDPSAMVSAFNKIGSEWTASIDKALQDGANSIKNFDAAARGSVAGVKGLTEEQRKLNAANEQVSLSLDRLEKSNEKNVKSQAKSLDMQTYVGRRIMEEHKELTKNFTDAQKTAFNSSGRYQAQILESEKRFQKEWMDANKSTAKKAKETYSVNRDNELQETKRFYEAQLKQLKDFESKQSQINKAGYESKAITYGQYVAREIELVASSQKQQLEVIQKSEDAYRKNIEARKKAQESAASAAIKSGANSSKINAKLAQELKNLSNESATAEENFKGLREALENAANAKYAEFFKELSKALFESNEELKKFSKSVEENARRRKEDLALEQKLLNVYGAEAEALKASTSTMRGYEGAINSANNALEEAVKHRQDLEKELSTVVGVDAYNRLTEQVREAVRVEDQLRKNARETRTLAEIDANQAATDAMQAYNLKVYKEMRDSLSESIYDAIFEGGKSGGQALKNVLKNMFKNYVINVILNPISNGLLGSAGLGGSGEGASPYGNLTGIASGLNNLKNVLGKGAAGAASSLIGKFVPQLYDLGFKSAAQGLGAFQAGMASQQSIAAFTSSLKAGGAQMAGAIAGSVLNGFSGYSISKLLSGGYEVNKYVNKIAGVASAIPGIGPIAGVVGGAINSLFGRKLKDSGIEGTFGGEQGFTGNTFEYYKGGAFRKSKTKRGALDEGTRSYFADQFTGTQSAIKAMGDALGLVTGAVDGATYSIKVSLKGLSEEDASKKIQEEFDRIAENMAELVLVTNEYSLADESRIETLTRLSSSLMTFNESLELLGLSAYDASLKSADAAYQIIAAFGGLEGYTQAIQGFYQNFYSEQERMDRLSQQLRDTLTGLDLSIDPSMGDKAKEQYRQAVESALSAGQVELATQLLAMSDTFATAADYAQQLADAATELSKNLRSSLTSLEAQFAGGGFSRQYQAEDVAKTIQQLLSGVGISKDVGLLTQALLTATSTDVESYFREIWNVLDTDEARLKLTEVTEGMLNLANATDEAARAAKEAAAAIAKERYELESRFLQTIGDTVALRKRELETLDPSNRALQERIWAIEDANKAVDEASKAMDAALNALAKSIDADKERINRDYDERISAIKLSISSTQEAIKTAQTSVDTLKTLFDEIADAVRTLRGQAIPEKQMSDARGFIDRALAGARGGAIPDQKRLSDAMGVVTNDSTSGYATAEDYKRVQLIQANKLEELGSLLGAQKTEAERQLEQLVQSNTLAEDQIVVLENARRQQLEALDMQLQKAREQVDILKGVDVGVKSVATAMSSLSTAMYYYQQTIAASIKTVADAIRDTEAESPGTVTVASRAGGGHTPAGLTLVGEEGPELVNFKSPSMVYTAPQTANLLRGDNSELIAEIQGLRREVVMLRAETRATAINTGKTYRILDDVTQGGNTVKVDQV